MPKIIWNERKKRRLISFFIIFIVFFISNTTYAFFEDIYENDSYFTSIKFLKENNIVNGYQDGTFRKNNFINRAEFVKMLIEGLFIEKENITNCFPDVKDDWYAKYVCTAKKLGWVNGYNDGLFYPDRKINKVEALKILIHAFDLYNLNINSYEKNFVDIDEKSWYIKYINIAKSKNLLEEQKYFLPDRFITRGQTAEIIFRLMLLKNLNINCFSNQLRNIIENQKLYILNDIKNNDLIKSTLNKNKCLEKLDIDFIENIDKKDILITLLKEDKTPVLNNTRWNLLKKYVNDWNFLDLYLKTESFNKNNIISDIFSLSSIINIDENIFKKLKDEKYIYNTYKKEDNINFYLKNIDINSFSKVDNDFLKLFEDDSRLISYFKNSNELIIKDDIKKFLEKNKLSQNVIDYIYIKLLLNKNIYNYSINNKLVITEILSILKSNNLIPRESIVYYIFDIFIQNDYFLLNDFKYLLSIFKDLINEKLVTRLLEKYLESDYILIYYPSLNKYFYEYLLDNLKESNISIPQFSIDNFVLYLYKKSFFSSYVLDDKNTFFSSFVVNYLLKNGYKISNFVIKDVFYHILLNENNIIYFDNKNSPIVINYLSNFINNNLYPDVKDILNIVSYLYSNDDLYSYSDKNSQNIILSLYNKIFLNIIKNSSFEDKKNLIFILLQRNVVNFKYIGIIIQSLNINIDLSWFNDIKEDILSNIIFNLFVNKDKLNINGNINDFYDKIKYKERLNALNRLNEIRKIYGFEDVKIYEKLNNVINMHCKYVNNHPDLQGLDKHNEYDTKSVYFRGKTVLDRIKAANIDLKSFAYQKNDIILDPEVTEVLLFDEIKGNISIDKWMTTVYHRYPLLNPYLSFIGFDFDANLQNNTLCTGINGINVYKDVDIKNDLIVYPYDGMENVDTYWDRRLEVPDPYPFADDYIVGSVITIQKYVKYSNYNEYKNDKFLINSVYLEKCLDLSCNTTLDVDIYIDKDNNLDKNNINAKNNVGISSKKPLEKNTKYKIKVIYTDKYGNKKTYISYFKTGIK